MFFSTNGSKEVLAVITTLESIEGLVIKKLRKGSLKIETCLHRMSALKTLIKYFESGKFLKIDADAQLVFVTGITLFKLYTSSFEYSLRHFNFDEALFSVFDQKFCVDFLEMQGHVYGYFCNGKRQNMTKLHSGRKPITHTISGGILQ